MGRRIKEEEEEVNDEPSRGGPKEGDLPYLAAV